VRKVHPLPPVFLSEQYEALQEDFSISGIKVGMLGWGQNIAAIQAILADNPGAQRVVDPVFKSSSGTWLLEKEAIPEYISKIRGNASLLTPNQEEAGLMAGMKVQSQEDMEKTAEHIYSISSIPCFITGGVFSDQSVNLLYDGKKFYFFRKERFKKKVHGTGCFLSSSLLAYLVHGNSLEKACHLATELTHKAIKDASRVGGGQHLI
jgi:hydroxymethylpyrimidine/phosphomethylpyrimidine kinase